MREPLVSQTHTPPRPNTVVSPSNLQKVVSFTRLSGYEPYSYACMLSRDVDAMPARLEDSVQIDGGQAIAFTILSDTMQVRSKLKRESYLAILRYQAKRHALRAQRSCHQGSIQVFSKCHAFSLMNPLTSLPSEHIANGRKVFQRARLTWRIRWRMR